MADIRFPGPVVPQGPVATPKWEVPDMSGMMEAFLAGRKMKAQQDELKLRQDELLQRAEHYAQLKRQAELESEMEGVKAKIDIFNLTKGTPTRDSDGVVTEGVGTPHAPIDIDAPSFGIRGTLRPTSAQEMSMLEAQAAGAKQRAEVAADQLDIPDWLAQQLGIPSGQMDPRLLAKAPTMVDAPAELGGGRMTEAQADLNAKVYGEKEATRRAGMAARSRENIANLRYTQAKTLPPEVVDNMASKVATGEVPLSQIPVPGGLRAAVLTNLATSDTAIPNKDLLAKLSQFNDAGGAVEELKARLADVEAAQATGDPIAMARTVYEFDVARNAMSRFVGRAMGEKGVFTDQDKADFARLLGYGMVATAVIPSLSRDRLAGIDSIMERIYTRNFNEYEQRVGSKLKLGAGAKNVPDASVPRVIGEIRKVTSRADVEALAPGTIFEYNNRRYERTAGGYKDAR